MRHRPSAGSALSALLLAACGATTSATTPSENTSASDTAGIECLGGIDTSDLCPTVPGTCIASYVPGRDDGCPDAAYPFPLARFAPGSVALSDEVMRTASGICSDALWPGASLRLVPVRVEGLAAERIATLRDALIACGVPAAQIRAGGLVPPPGPGGVYAPDDVVIAVDDCAVPPT